MVYITSIEAEIETLTKELEVKHVEWMEGLDDSKTWIVVTADLRISSNKHEAEAWKKTGHIIFFLNKAWIHLGMYEQASKFFHYLPTIMDTAKKAKKGDGFIVPVKGMKIKRF